MKEPYKKGVANHLDPESCSLHGNRETPKASTTPNAYRASGGGERPEKADGRTSGRHAFGESDGSIVPQKQANKADASAAEPVEGREPTQGNGLPVGHAPDTVPGPRGRTRRDVRTSRTRGSSSWTQGKSRMR